MCFFGGAYVRWQKEPIGAVNASRRSATITLDEKIFPHTTIQAQIYFDRKPSIPGLPARVQYVGILNLEVDATSSLKLSDVQGYFGSNFRRLGISELSPHGSPTYSSGKVFVFYLYPGDDPAKYGAAELPQIRFLLKQGDVAPSPIQRYEPQDSDFVTSIFMCERASRK